MQNITAQAAARQFVASTIACMDAHDPQVPLADERRIFSTLLKNHLGTFIDPTPADLPCVDYLQAALNPRNATSGKHADLLKSCAEVAPFCQWRNKYRNGGNPELAQRFGFCDIVGADGYWLSDEVTLGLVILGPGTFYPFHQHPARELYFVLSGSALWGVDQQPLVPRDPGTFILHTENQPHAMRALEDPLLGLSLWRGQINRGSNFTDTKTEAF